MKKDFLKSIALVIFLIFVFQLFGCSLQHPFDNSTNISEENFAKAWKSKFYETDIELERRRVLWKENKIANYDFVVTKYAGGQTNTWNRSPVIIKVREGEKISIEVESKTDKSSMARTDAFEAFDTIDKLFEYLYKELEKGKMLEVEYDIKSGFPKSVRIEDSFEIHGYRNITISKFEVIE